MRLRKSALCLLGFLGCLSPALMVAFSSELVFSNQPLANPMVVKGSQTLIFTVLNTQTKPIHLNKIDLGPHDDPRYWKATNDCSEEVNPGKTCHIHLVLFAPSDPGFMNTVLVVNYGHSNLTLRSKPIQFDITALPPVLKTKELQTATVPKKSVTKPVYHPSPKPQRVASSAPKQTATATQRVATSSQVVFVPTGYQSAPILPPLKHLPTSGLVLNLYGGGANLHGKLGDEVFPPVFPGVPPQTNTLHGSSSLFDFTGGGGLAYDFVMPAAASGQNDYAIRDISLGINAYYVGGHDFNGEVYRFGLPQFNFDNYDLNLQSTRVMIDSEWDFHPIGQHVIPFIMGGIGDAINNMSYKETPISANQNPGGQLSLDSHITHNFAYELGLGVKVALTPDSLLSLRYLYSDLGSAQVDSSVLSEPLSLNSLHTSSVLLGYTYEFEN